MYKLLSICTSFQVPITFSDLEFVDDELYKHLKHLKKLSNAQKVSPAAYSIASLLLDFTVTYETKDKYEQHLQTYIHTYILHSFSIHTYIHTYIPPSKMIHYDLVPNGGSKIVTADNLNDYLQARLRHRFGTNP